MNEDAMVYPINTKHTSESAVILKDTASDPYKLSVMQAAYQQITSSIQLLTPTGKYVRVLVSDYTYDMLVRYDSSIVWFDYPLEYDISQPGAFYEDCTLHNDTMFWVYGVVPVDFHFFGAPVVPIYDVFIPMESGLMGDNIDLCDSMEFIAYEMCGYNAELKENTKSASRWYPSATVSVWDDILNTYVPLQGVKVVAHRGTYTTKMFTSGDGQCVASKSYKYKVDYSIKWERNDWRIKEGCKNSFMNGPRSGSSWSINIGSSSGANLGRATIHRAALMVRFGNIWNVTRPFGSGARKIMFVSGNGGGKVGSASCKPGAVCSPCSDITIWRYSDYGAFTTDKILAGTAHELAHWSHYRAKGNAFNLVQPQIFESWAFCLEWYFMNYMYSVNYGTAGYQSGHQDWNQWTQSVYTNYTPVFIDLIDSYNQSLGNSNNCNDNVSGYTLPEIENRFVKKSNTFTQLKTELYKSDNLLHGTTLVDMTNLMAIYEDLIY